MRKEKDRAYLFSESDFLTIFFVYSIWPTVATAIIKLEWATILSKEFSKHQYGFERLSTGFLNQFESLVGAGDELTVSSTSRCYSELGFPSATLKQIQKFSILAYLAPYFPQYENTGRSASFRANNTMINMEISKCFVRSPIYLEHANFYDFYSPTSFLWQQR